MIITKRFKGGIYAFGSSVLLLVVLCLSASKCSAQTTSQNFAKTVQNDLVVKLDSNDRWTEEDKRKARQNIEILIDALRKVNFDGSIDESSLVWLKKGMAKSFSDASVIFDKSTTELISKEVANKLNGVNNSHIKVWMSKSEKLVSSADIYRNKYMDHLVSKFASSKHIEIRMRSNFKGTQINGVPLDVIFNILAIKISDDKSVYDAQDNDFASKLLTLMTVRLFDDYFEYIKSADDIVNTSIASETFGKKYPKLLEKQMDFEHSKPYIDKIINPIIIKEGDTTLFYPDSFEWVMYPVMGIRHINVGIPNINPESYAKITPPGEYRFTIKFKNDRIFWKLLPDVEK